MISLSDVLSLSLISVSDVLLGMDFLESNKAKIDFEHKTLAIGKHVFVLKENIAEKSPQNVMLATTKHKRILEPRSVFFCQIRCQIEN